MVYFVVMSSKTAFFKLEDVFPECSLYREKYPNLESLVCIRADACHAGHNCMETLTKRLHVIFDDLLPSVELIFLYFKKLGDLGMGAGVFWRDFREPRVITVNPKGWHRIKRCGDVYKFTPEPGFFLSGRGLPENDGQAV